jgi:tetratricopeptide (TPR) repeat protein
VDKHALNALFQKASELHRQGNQDQAKKAYQQILAIAPRHADTLHLFGILMIQTNQFENASELIAQAVAIDPNQALYHSNLGVAWDKIGDAYRAEQCFRRAIELAPNHADYHFNLGIALRAINRPQQAIDCFDQSIRLQPNHAKSFMNRGIALIDLELHEQSLDSYDAALAIRPDYVEALANRSIALHELKRWSESIASCDRAIAIKPDFAEAHFNRGIALKGLQQYDAAIASYETALRCKPSFPQAHFNRGNALYDLKRIREAIASYEAALSLEPRYGEATYNLSIALLLSGDFERGLELFEVREQRDTPGRVQHSFSKPRWNGIDSLAGKRILICSEQGLGDTIQFCRYVPLLMETGLRVLFAPQSPLRKLMETLLPSVEIVDLNDPTLEFDFHLSLLSLPLALKNYLPSVSFKIPCSIPYLTADPSRVESWRNHIGDSGFKIGVCWFGSTGENARGRSFPAKQIESISQMDGVRLLCLAKGKALSEWKEETDESAKLAIETFGDEFDEGPDAFLDTATVMLACDLVITCDTAVAHLAGALGVPVWVALKFVPDWRWMLNRSDSPWYPTMKLFRQTTNGDWNSVFAEMRTELEQLLVG